MSRYISEKNLIQHELIGLHATIIDTPCKSLANISGQVIDETMNTLTIEYLLNGSQKIVIIPKHKTTFKFILPKTSNNPLPKTVVIDGTLIRKRPEDRIKKLAKIVNRFNKKKSSKHEHIKN